MNKIFVVYWVNLDNDCLKKSEIKIVGVYDTEEQAKAVSEKYEHKGYCYDDRCYYCWYDNKILNEEPEWKLCEWTQEYKDDEY